MRRGAKLSEQAPKGRPRQTSWTLSSQRERLLRLASGTPGCEERCWTSHQRQANHPEPWWMEASQ
eukprot:2052107-Prymnesium_polylepis.1